jgi:hypothetical protein
MKSSLREACSYSQENQADKRYIFIQHNLYFKAQIYNKKTIVLLFFYCPF